MSPFKKWIALAFLAFSVTAAGGGPSGGGPAQGGTPGGTSGQIQYNNNGSFGGLTAAGVSSTQSYGPGSKIYGDSIGAGTGATYQYFNGWSYITGKVIGGPLVINARPGDQCLDTNYNYIHSAVNGDYLNTISPTTIIECGTNDVTAQVASANQTNYGYYLQRIIQGNIYWAGIPYSQKSIPSISTTGWTFTGTWATDATQSLVDNNYATTTSGATATYTFTTTAASTVPVLGYSVYNGGTGTFTLLQDGSSYTDTINSGATTFYASGDGGVAINTGNGATQGVAVVRFNPVSAGTHTIKITTTSSGKVGVNFVGLATPGTANPGVVLWTTPHQNNGNDTEAGVVAGYVSSLVAQAASDGLNVYLSDVRSALFTNNAINLYVIPGSTTYNNSATWISNSGVKYASSGTALTLVGSSPAKGQYSVSGGVYTFNAADIEIPLYISQTINCGSTLTTAASNCMVDNLHPNNLLHAVDAAVTVSALPTNLATGVKLPLSEAPLRNYIPRYLLPSEMMTPNAYNLSAPATGVPGFIPGIIWNNYVGQVSFTTYSGSHGILTVMPNAGSGIGWSICTPSGTTNAPIQNESQLATCYLTLSGNGALTANTATTINGGTTITATGGSQYGLKVTQNSIEGTDLEGIISVNTYTPGVSAFEAKGTGHSFSFGVGNSAETNYNVPNEFFIYDKTNSVLALTYNPTGTAWTFKGTSVSVPQIIGSGSTPTIAAGAAAGTGPTVSITGTNLAGVITVGTGTATTGSATLSTITFNGTLATAPQGCNLQPRNTAAALANADIFTTSPSTTAWTIAVAGTALTASTNYSWSFSCF